MLRRGSALSPLLRFHSGRQIRANSHDSSEKTNDKVETPLPNHSSHPPPETESFGRGFWIALIALPSTLALIKFMKDSASDPDQGPFLTQLMRKYSSYEDEWKRRNALHTAMVEQAGRDRNLFLNTSRPLRIELRFPEVFNTGSPYNVAAGHSTNLDALIAHYEQENREMAEKVAKRSMDR